MTFRLPCEPIQYRLTLDIMEYRLVWYMLYNNIGQLAMGYVRYLFRPNSV